MYSFVFIFSFFCLNIFSSAAALDCESGQLLCDSGDECIDSESWCDGDVNCKDDSDEEYCKKASWWLKDPNNCEDSDTHFLCSDGICVPKTSVCNGHGDCKDLSDENNCDSNEDVSTTLKFVNEVVTQASTKTTTDSEEYDEYDENEYDENDQKSTTTEVEDIDIETTSISSGAEPSEASTIPDYDDYEETTAFIPQTTISDKKTTTKHYSVAPTTPRTHYLNHTSRTVSYPKPTTTRRPPTDTVYKPVYYNRSSYYRPPVFKFSSYVLQPNVNNRPLTHDTNRRPSTHDIRSNGNRPWHHDARPSHQTHGVHTSVSVNRPHYNNRPYDRRQPSRYDARDNNMNGKPDWKDAASLKPFNRETEINEPFHFAKDHFSLFSRNNARYMKDSEVWILKKRRSGGDWGKDTARAMIALGLASNYFSNGNEDRQLMKKNFITQLSVNLIKENTGEFSINQMATSMNALLAVCEDPRDFHGMDLTQVLRVRIREHIKAGNYLNPFVYLSLCLSGNNLTSSEVQHLMKQMRPSSPLYEMSKDIQSMAIQAFACYMQQQLKNSDHAYRMSLHETLRDAVTNLLQRVDEDGSFGSVYSTALAAQALLSVNDSYNWNADKTISFLRKHQLEDGFFGDLLATYLVLPVLSGRSLLYLRNIRCTEPPVNRDLTPDEIEEFVGQKQYIHYSIYFGVPLENSHSIRVLVPLGISFFDIMRVASYQDDEFRFLYEEKGNNILVYSLSGMPNDFERGFSWYSYVKQDSDPRPNDHHTRERYTGDLREFRPTPGQHLIFWYHPIGI